MVKKLEKNLLVMISIIIGLIILFPTMFVNAEGTTESVPSPVAISDFKMSQQSAKKDETIKYSFTLTDIGLRPFLEKYGEMYDIYPEYTGVYEITLCWSSIKGQKLKHTYTWDFIENGDGVWNTESIKISGKLPVRKGMQKGEWNLKSIYFAAGGDNAGFYICDNRYPIYDTMSGVLMDFSMADFTVSGTGKVDNKAPTLDLKSLKITKKYVKKNQKSTFSLKIKDTSKIKEVTCGWLVYDKNDYSGDYSAYRYYPMNYNKKKKRYQCSMKLDAEFYRKAELYCITVEDIYGNKKSYSSYRTNFTKIKKYYNSYKNITVSTK